MKGSSIRAAATAIGSSGPVGSRPMVAAYRPGWARTSRAAHGLRPGGHPAGSALDGRADRVAGLVQGEGRDAAVEVVLAGDALVERGGPHADPFGQPAHAEAGEADLVGEVGAGRDDRSVPRPALGTDAGQEGQHGGGHLGRVLYVRVVPGALDHLQAAQAGGQVGDDGLTLGLGLGPVGVGAALDDQDWASDVAQLLSGVDGGGLPIACKPSSGRARRASW